MAKLLIIIYNFFDRHKFLLYLSLILSTGLMLFFASKIKFNENVARFFPDNKDSKNSELVFDNLKVKDKIIIMISSTDSLHPASVDSLIDAEKRLENSIQKSIGGTYVKDIFSHVDSNVIEDVTDFIYSHLPIFLSDSDYIRLDTVVTAQGIENKMHTDYSNLLSPAGMALKKFILRDPLGVGNSAMARLKDFQKATNYKLQNGYIFTEDEKTLLFFVTPTYSMGKTGKNEVLISTIEEAIAKVNQSSPSIHAEYFGGPSVSVYNARQIKHDTMLTMNIALLIIVVFIFLVFKSKSSIPLLITPVLYGTIFALCLIYFFKGGISGIAIGAGAAVFGIALSYSIHVLAHNNHVSSPQQLIKELAYPMTVGSFTTVGAFFGLIFTSSDLLRDFGWFASLSLIGTTFFCLIYLPHFLKGKKDVKQGLVLRLIEKANAYPFDRNKWLVGLILGLIVISLFTSQSVGFDNDMRKLNFEPPNLKQSEQKLTQLFQTNKQTVMFVSVGKNMKEALSNYAATNEKLEDLKKEGKIIDYAAVNRILIPEEVQQQRIAKWNAYWTPEKKKLVADQLKTNTAKLHFKENSFNRFNELISKDFNPYDFSQNEGTASKLLSEWTTSIDSLSMIVTQVRIDGKLKESVYKSFSKNNNVVVFDRSFFTNKWVSAINNDFYFILYMSSLLIFVALLISFGRIEITLISFLPMMVSWIIILGLMGILGIQFNIVNIILSTFIFGTGDDFSIFIMDGLQGSYRTGTKMLNSHKTAIFFSAFTTIVGMGALMFAKHPALQSIALISIVGMSVVVLVAFTIQPILFRLLISDRTAKGKTPHSMKSLLSSGFMFLYFFLGCMFLKIVVALFYITPLAQKKKKLILSYLIHYTCRSILFLAFGLKKKHINESKEKFKKPAILIANHQSFIDILVMLALQPKFLIVTNRWVWESPVFGSVIRYADFCYIGNGYEQFADQLKDKIEQGYSIVIFPEGSRSEDDKIRRFHKGAFFLADKLGLDIVPVILYGNGNSISKKDPFYVHQGTIVSKILPRIAYGDSSWGNTYQERTKKCTSFFKREYDKVYAEYNTTDNSYFYHKLMSNYIYKGPVEEWYIRIKVRMEKSYKVFNELIPMKCTITDIGCGYGPLSFMLSLISKERTIFGIDYDEDKVELAQHSYIRTPNLHFEHADAVSMNLPKSDVFILSDVLHYINFEQQDLLLDHCSEQLNANGMIIVRDGNEDDHKKHRLTKLTETFSTKVLGFNKTNKGLYFTSRDRMMHISKKHALSFREIKNDKYTSNTIYVLTKNGSNEQI